MLQELCRKVPLSSAAKANICRILEQAVKSTPARIDAVTDYLIEVGVSARASVCVVVRQFARL